MENLKKVKQIFQSPAVAAVFRWSACVHGSVILICVLNAAGTLLSLGETLATKELIDGAVAGSRNALLLWGGCVIATTLTSRMITVWLAMTRIKASTKLQCSIQGMIVQRLLSREYAGLMGYHSGEMVNRFFSDAGTVKNGVMNLLPNFVSTAISFFGAAAILVAMDWRFVPLLIVGGCLGLAIVLLFRNPMKKRHKRMQEAEDKLHSSVQETLENLRLIKASLSENRFARMIGGRQEGLKLEQIRQGRFSLFMNNGVGLVFDLSWLFCMIWGCVSISRGLLTYGALAAIIQLIWRIESPIANAMNLASEAYGVVASAERLEEMISLPEEEQGESLADFDEIRVEDVSFQYKDEQETVLNRVNCVFPKGSFTALTGISGGGKTTLFHLLLGIYRPTEGKIIFRSGSREIPPSRGVRSLFAYVPQGNTLFSGTLRDNLTMFTDCCSEEEIDQAVKAACIEDLVKEVSLDAMLGERGVGLSEGQAQRVAVARALLSKAPILLLDESTSALDEETEAQLLQNISALRDKTCIIVTHRRAALGICSRVLNIADGRLTEKNRGD
ncbi:MAG: ABC transporter ATP-binding protein [Clostridia bacterium]|nr:ABC transporter ATP-binding protein [Clostridia bacterium]